MLILMPTVVLSHTLMMVQEAHLKAKILQQQLVPSMLLAYLHSSESDVTKKLTQADTTRWLTTLYFLRW